MARIARRTKDLRRWKAKSRGELSEYEAAVRRRTKPSRCGGGSRFSNTFKAVCGRVLAITTRTNPYCHLVSTGSINQINWLNLTSSSREAGRHLFAFRTRRSTPTLARTTPSSCSFIARLLYPQRINPFPEKTAGGARTMTKSGVTWARTRRKVFTISSMLMALKRLYLHPSDSF